VTSRRRLALAEQRGDRDSQRVRVLRSGFGGDLGNAGLNSIDLKIRDTEFVGQTLATPLLGATNLFDSSSNKGKFARHSTALSELDRPRNSLSTLDAQAGVTVGHMASAHEITREEIEARMVAVGYKRDDGKPDWERVLVDGGVPKGQKDVVPSRWGSNRFQMKKVIAAIERAEQKRPTPQSTRKQALDDWNEIGRALSLVPEVFEREIARLRTLGSAAIKVEEGERARTLLLSPTPEPKKARK